MQACLRTSFQTYLTGAEASAADAASSSDGEAQEEAEDLGEAL